MSKSNQLIKKITFVLGWFAYLSAILIGLYGSLKVVVSLSRIDPDTCHSLMLWEGISSHGLSWVKGWIFTQDNWLFSLSPFHFVGFLVFGAKPEVAVFGGWVIFVLSALTSGAIAWQLNANRAALLIPLLLLLAGHFVHLEGFASYSTSHNITNLFGLVCLLVIIRWLRTRKSINLLLIFLLLAAGAVSDPWMIAAYNLPILLVSVAMCFIPALSIRRIECVKLFLVALLSILAVKTKLFGALSFLPSVDFHLGSWAIIKNNGLFLMKNMGGMLDIFPLHNADDLFYAAMSILAVVTLLLFNIVKASRSKLAANTPIIVITLCSAFSIGGIALAYVIGGIEATGITARFLLNCFYLISIGLVVLIDRNWQRSSSPGRIVSVSVMLLFLAAGISSNWQAWQIAGFAIKDGGTNAIVDFLRKEKLSYGYGPYWGAHANAVTAASGFTIRIRPVVFDKTNGSMLAGIRPESSKHWYSTNDAPIGQKEYFVFVRSDGEECADMNICIEGLNHQFGNPVRQLKYQDATILIWDHPLIGPAAMPR